jgi:hypothetical protein
MRIILPTAPASAITAGVVAASITFATMSYAGEATVGATHYGTRAVGFLAKHGVKFIFGPVSGFIVEQATLELGDQILTPVVRTGSRQTAYITSAAIGAAVVAMSTVIIHTSSWIYRKGHKAVCQYLTQPPSEVVANIMDIGNDIILLTVDGVPARPPS